MTVRALLPILVAACSFDGNTPVIDGVPGVIDAPRDPPDADPDQPDAVPGQPDAVRPPDARVDAPPGFACPAGYTLIVGGSLTSWYRFESANQKSWVDAENDCEDDALPGDLPSHLVVIDDPIERTALINGPTGTGFLNDQWIGLTDLYAETMYLYVTPQATVSLGNLSGNMPDEDCVRLKNNMNQETRNCGESNRFVCECDGLAADPGRFPNPPDGNP
jgi:hypothetical protein